MPRQTWTLTQADTSFLIDQAVKAAQGMGLAITVAVVQEGGIMIGLLRMEGVKLASCQAAQSKAWTSALFQRASGDYAAVSSPGGEAYGLLNVYPGQLGPILGGRPIMFDKTCLGGIGISGSSAAQDDAIASAALEAFMKANAKGAA